MLLRHRTQYLIVELLHFAWDPLSLAEPDRAQIVLLVVAVVETFLRFRADRCTELLIYLLYYPPIYQLHVLVFESLLCSSLGCLLI